MGSYYQQGDFNRKRRYLEESLRKFGSNKIRSSLIVQFSLVVSSFAFWKSNMIVVYSDVLCYMNLGTYIICLKCQRKTIMVLT